MINVPEAIRWQDGQLSLLDQRRLPQSIEYLDITSLENAWTAINTLAVRGAPAIGVAAAYALASQASNTDPNKLANALPDMAAYLKSARPTAVNLAWAVDRLMAAYDQDPRLDTLLQTAADIHREDQAICLGLGEHGATLIKPNSAVLTHCNAGALATSGIGTATAPMYTQHAAGVPFKVFADETRPLYQGARLTVWELTQAGIDTTLLADSMAATLMASGQIDLVLVGTDRVAANGDVVNKIGTLNVAILCRHYDVPFYVACPSSTYDPNTPSGSEVVIEQRDRSEVLGSHAYQESSVINPAFDVTPADLVTGIITEQGIFQPSELKAVLNDPQ